MTLTGLGIESSLLMVSHAHFSATNAVWREQLTQLSRPICFVCIAIRIILDFILVAPRVECVYRPLQVKYIYLEIGMLFEIFIIQSKREQS